jgi:hypothetical protein
MGSRMGRSVAFTVEVDAALAELAEVEGTSRADLVRQGITLLFRSRGIDLDASAGITTDRVAVAHRRDRRRSPRGDRHREAFRVWYDEHRASVVADGRHDPELVDRTVVAILDRTDRHGRASGVLEAVVPGGWAEDFRAAAAVDAILAELAGLEAVTRARPRTGPGYLIPAPWAAAD